MDKYIRICFFYDLFFVSVPVLLRFGCGILSLCCGGGRASGQCFANCSMPFPAHCFLPCIGAVCCALGWGGNQYSLKYMPISWGAAGVARARWAGWLASSGWLWR